MIVKDIFAAGVFRGFQQVVFHIPLESKEELTLPIMAKDLDEHRRYFDSYFDYEVDYIEAEDDMIHVYVTDTLVKCSPKIKDGISLEKIMALLSEAYLYKDNDFWAASIGGYSITRNGSKVILEINLE